MKLCLTLTGCSSSRWMKISIPQSIIRGSQATWSSKNALDDSRWPHRVVRVQYWWDQLTQTCEFIDDDISFQEKSLIFGFSRLREAWQGYKDNLLNVLTWHCVFCLCQCYMGSYLFCGYAELRCLISLIWGFHGTCNDYMQPFIAFLMHSYMEINASISTVIIILNCL